MLWEYSMKLDERKLDKVGLPKIKSIAVNKIGAIKIKNWAKIGTIKMDKKKNWKIRKKNCPTRNIKWKIR